LNVIKLVEELQVAEEIFFGIPVFFKTSLVPATLIAEFRGGRIPFTTGVYLLIPLK